MDSFKRTFDPLDLEIIDRVYEVAWAYVEAREPDRNTARDGERQKAAWPCSPHGLALGHGPLWLRLLGLEKHSKFSWGASVHPPVAPGIFLPRRCYLSRAPANGLGGQ
jgi:hypothetical protein